MKVASTGNQIGAKGNVVNVADIANEQMGGYGMEFVSDTAAHTPATGYIFCAIQVVADAVLAAYAPAASGNALTGVTLPAGTVIYGRFTSITLASGKLIAYKGV